jgi:hypothetical protein
LLRSGVGAANGGGGAGAEARRRVVGGRGKLTCGVSLLAAR